MRRAGVSSFGVGGTNVHVVVEEAPEVPAHAEPTGTQVLLLSAQTAAALGESRSDLATALEGPDGPDLSDVAFTLAGRRKHNITMAAVVRDREHAVTVLRAAEHDNVFVGESTAVGMPKRPNHPQTASSSCFPVRALSTSEWRKGSTTPNPSSPNTSTPAPRDSVKRWAPNRPRPARRDI